MDKGLIGIICRHCKQHRVNRPRGLCWSCYYTPGVAAKYPSTSKYASRGHGNGHFTPTVPEPTLAAPGTPEKEKVLTERCKNRQHLFHEFDARWEGDTRANDYRKAMGGSLSAVDTPEPQHHATALDRPGSGQSGRDGDDEEIW